MSEPCALFEALISAVFEGARAAPYVNVSFIWLPRDGAGRPQPSPVDIVFTCTFRGFAAQQRVTLSEFKASENPRALLADAVNRTRKLNLEAGAE